MYHSACRTCSEPFEARIDAKFCSVNCRMKAHRAHRADIVARARAAGIW